MNKFVWEEQDIIVYPVQKFSERAEQNDSGEILEKAGWKHKHDMWLEHPIRVKDHQKWFAGVKEKEKNADKLVEDNSQKEQKILTETPVEKSNIMGVKTANIVLKQHLKNDGDIIFKPVKGSYAVSDFYPIDTLPEREVAAYIISKMFFPGLVPITVLRIDPKHGKGMGQEFIHDEEREDFNLRGFKKTSNYRQAAIFDIVIGNSDRHMGNGFVMKDNKLKLFDHGYSFPGAAITIQSYITEGLWDTHLDEKELMLLNSILDQKEQIVEALKNLLSPKEIELIFVRVKRTLEKKSFWINFYERD